VSSLLRVFAAQRFAAERQVVLALSRAEGRVRTAPAHVRSDTSSDRGQPRPRRFIIEVVEQTMGHHERVLGGVLEVGALHPETAQRSPNE
jgi:hypothetical protein